MSAHFPSLESATKQLILPRTPASTRVPVMEEASLMDDLSASATEFQDSPHTHDWVFSRSHRQEVPAMMPCCLPG